MLLLARKEGEKVLIYPGRDTSPEMTLAELFEHGAIEIIIHKHDKGKARIGIEAPAPLKVRRAEIEERRSWPASTDESLLF